MDPIIISVAPNGARKTKQDHPAIPLSIEEIARDARQCADAGATLLHMHIRDAEGKHSLDSGVYKEAIAETKNLVGDDLIIQCTTESVGIYNTEQQIQMVYDVKPESFSFAVRRIIDEPEYEGKFKELIEWSLAERIIPQYIFYSPEDVIGFAELRKKQVIPGEKIFVLFVLGKKSDDTSDPASFAVPEDLDPYLEIFGDGILQLKNTNWGVCAFGGNENSCVKKAVECGGHPRIGFENNHLMADGNMAENNADLVRQFVESIENIGRIIASSAQAKTLLA